MITKLYIDDIRSTPDTSWVKAETVETAIKAIYRYHASLKEISLDHDISHQVTINDISRPYPCRETFMSVAYYVVALYGGLPSEEVPLVTIHTANPVGAKEMQKVFGEAGILSQIKAMPPANRLEGHE